MRVPLSKPEITETDIQEVVATLRSGQLSLGPRVEEFEQKFANFVGRRCAVAVSSGTAALHLCVRALGIGAQDEILTSSFSFVASANCALYEGALPVFVDIDPFTLNLDPVGVRRFLEEYCDWNPHTRQPIDRRNGRTVKAILPVHVFGHPCEMEPLLEIAREYNLDLIEDACEALGAAYQGKAAGRFGSLAAFAFYPNKQMTTAEGGMIVTDNEALAHSCRSMRNQGRAIGSSWLEHERLGYNYRLSDLHCALGIAQLERLHSMLKAREAVAAEYNRLLNDEIRVALPQTMKGCERSWFVYVVQVKASKDVRDAVIQQLRKRGIGAQAYFPAIHQQPYMQSYEFVVPLPLPVTEAASDHCLAIPMSSQTTKQEIAIVCEELKSALDAAELETAEDSKNLVFVRA